MLKVSIGGYNTGWQKPKQSIEQAIDLISTRAQEGARLVVLPEMSPSGFTMNTKFAEKLTGDSIAAFANAALENKVYVLAGIATHRNGKYYNSALLFGDNGNLFAAYDKQKMFKYAGEDKVFSAGTDSIIFDIDGIRATVFICYDLRFPFLFNEVCPYVDVALIIANWPEERDSHWRVLTQARSIENQVYVIGVNREGEGGGLYYKKAGSVAYLPSGEPAPIIGDSASIVDVDPVKVTEVRTNFPVIEDRRSIKSRFGRFPSVWT